MSRHDQRRGGAAMVCAALWIAVAGSGQAATEGTATEGAVWADAERIEVASGNAHAGPWRMNESDYDYIDDPTVAITSDRQVGVAWADLARQNIFFQIYGANGEAQFSNPVNVSSHPGIFSWLPRLLITLDDERRGYVLWQEIVFTGAAHGGEIFFARSTDGGATFSDALNLSNSEAGAGKGRLTREAGTNGSLDLAEGPDGHLYAAWSEYEGRLWVSRSTDAAPLLQRLSTSREMTTGRLARPPWRLPATAPSISPGQWARTRLPTFILPPRWTTASRSVSRRSWPPVVDMPTPRRSP